MSRRSAIAAALVLSVSIALTACGGADDSPEESAKLALGEFYEALTDDPSKACDLLTSDGQLEVVTFFSDQDDPALRATENCEQVAGTKLASKVILAQKAAQDASSMSVDANGSTATVTLDLPDPILRTVMMRKFGDTWRIESFVTMSAS